MMVSPWFGKRPEPQGLTSIAFHHLPFLTCVVVVSALDNMLGMP